MLWHRNFVQRHPLRMGLQDSIPVAANISNSNRGNQQSRENDEDSQTLTARDPFYKALPHCAPLAPFAANARA